MGEISVGDAKAGMVLDATLYHAENHNLLMKAGTELTETKIAQLTRMGVKYLDVADPFTRYIGPYEKMEQYLKTIYEKYIQIYASEKPEENLNDQMIRASMMIKKIVGQVCNKENILNLCLQMHIQTTDQLFEQAVLTSVFSGLLAGSMELTTEEITNSVVGGLLHNIGLLEMAHLLPAKDKLVGQQELLWKEHPGYGYHMAIQEGISREVAHIILTHEERWDGSGYPNQIKEKEIPLESRIISVCSHVTDAMIFGKQQPYETLEYLYGTSNRYFDKRIVDAFAENVALYPLGSLVRLTTGEVGVVSNIRKNKGPRPVVNVYFNRFNKPYSSPKMVDLGQERTIFISQIMGF